ncbi:phosphate ABC transporter permease PstA [Pseudohaliea rubra]|uniref:Phosphate transport system permease protein PstA n=1 Tax=Pseudohaliea rubra DSM 19751 TaxID=1265313 RepID=A0A095VPV7_9GAMM|nr:phosphate ABC transporter permease PstA [Pseudohaliea rubra]KGE03425.1 Phosphate transport system permease protein PstA [Pseudohaliea rubra DSM 19751]
MRQVDVVEHAHRPLLRERLRASLRRKGSDALEWLAAGAAALALVAVLGLVALLTVKGLGHFWPGPLWALELRAGAGAGDTLLGHVVARREVPVAQLREAGRDPGPGSAVRERLLLRLGNRDLGAPEFRWVLASDILEQHMPPSATVLERSEWGPLFGYPLALRDGDVTQVDGDGPALRAALAKALEATAIARERLRALEQGPLAAASTALARLPANDASGVDEVLKTLAQLETERRVLRAVVDRYVLRLALANGQRVEQPLATVLRAYQPNALAFPARVGLYLQRLWDFVSGAPREGNTDGGVFPAIFGTVALVLLTAVLVTPLGVLAAVYLHEYARQGPLTRLVRIAVNNLAGVPSLVFGVFGLGFFVYVLGGELDSLFFADRLPSPTFGSPGLLWASLTLALLTLPVVVVATEEGLARIPRSVREGSLALGATRAETLWRVVLPMATPAMMTGLVLAVARAAGEVAPLMLVGVVKLAPTLPVSEHFPYLHLEQKFMNLGFHIYDIGFHSPDPDATRSLVFATAFLLVAIILVLNLAAVILRHRLRERYKSLDT